jgi:hypothetical protein
LHDVDILSILTSKEPPRDRLLLPRLPNNVNPIDSVDGALFHAYHLLE